ncbi:MAG: hypothetical protein ACKVT0_20025 [Planctomycetaceae bacterium]
MSSQKPGRLIHLTLFGWMLAICCTGCRWDRSYFQFDSNSQIPFFGLEFRLPPTAQSDRSEDQEFSQTPAKTVPQPKIRAQSLR